MWGGVCLVQRDISISPCSGPFLHDVPGFHIPHDSFFPGLDIGLVGPVARGASRFENLLAPQKTYWPGGPVDLKTYWPPKKLTGPPKN